MASRNGPRQELQHRWLLVHDDPASGLAGPSSVIGAISAFQLPPSLVVLAAAIADTQPIFAASIDAGAAAFDAARIGIHRSARIGIKRRLAAAMLENESLGIDNITKRHLKLRSQ